MKAQNIVLVLVVVIMLASLGGTYFLFSQQGLLSSQKIDALKIEIDGLSTSLKNFGSQFTELELKSRGYAESIKNLENKVDAGDIDRKGIVSKVDELMKAVDDIKGAVKSAEAVEQVKAEASIYVPEFATEVAQSEESIIAQTEAVDLGQIPVQK